MAELDEDFLVPGTPEAVEAGCECPSDQPQAPEGVYIFVMSCPLHAGAPEPTDGVGWPE